MKGTHQQTEMIVQFLQHCLNNTSSLNEKALLIDSLGNTGSTLSLHYLHECIQKNEAVNVQHAAVRALRHHKDAKVQL